MLAKRLFCSVLLLSLTSAVFAQESRTCNLKCENQTDPLGIDNGQPHFSWQLQAPMNVQDERQTAYEIEVASDRALLAKGKADVWSSGKVGKKQQIMVPFGGEQLPQRSLCYWRVRAYDKAGKPTEWSETARFSVGLDESTMQGDFIIQPRELGNQESPVFWKTINIRKLSTTLMHVNSLGYHEVYVNGQRISETVLAPAMTQLNKRSAIVTYDITHALKKGANDVVVCLGQGWYKRNTFDAQHDGPIVKAEIDQYHGKRCTVIASTDSSWRVAQTGYQGIGSWAPLQFGGERLDGAKNIFRRPLTAANLSRLPNAAAEVTTVENIKATPQMFEGNRIVCRLRPIYVSKTDGGYVFDLGRNITGWWQMTFRSLSKGQEVKMEYADDMKDGAFEPQGEYDVFVSGGESDEMFVNRFHSHAYRYVRVSGLGYEPSPDDCKGLQITGTDDSTTDFACSDANLCAIHDMVQRTLRCLTFSGYSVDCPHLERMGYGGDGNSSTMTLQTMFDAAPTYYNWIQAWADAQDPDGGMPHVAPAGGGGGGPYWCGFIIQAPFRAFMNYADDRMLVSHYDSMTRWLEYVKQYSPDGLLGRWPDTKNRMWFLGDWLTPAGVDGGNEKSVMLVSNCFVAECLQSMTTIAKHLGKDTDAEQYAKWRSQLLKKIHATYYNAADNTYGSGSPLDMAYAMNAGAVPADIYNKVEKKLVELSRSKYNTHIAVGLVGVAIFTEWATRNREANLMYDILKQPDYPGYMDMILNGATTTWESWDRSRSRIHNCYNGIGTWFYQALGGIIPEAEHPGYEHFTVAPQYPDALQWAKVNKETPYGTIAVFWRRSAGKTQLEVTVPVGTTATIHSPDGNKEVGSGYHNFLF